MPRKAAKSKTVLPDHIPNGEILTDISKKQWYLGPSIGVGGFGEIYSAADYIDNKKPVDFPYAIKIEPHDNGPLFCEMHFFMRNAKPDMVKSWCTEKKLTNFGMPRLLGSGSHERKNKKYRFLVMDKYGSDLWNIFLKHKRKFSLAVIYRIALQILEVLEYIHNNEYVHADIKGSNLLLGITKQAQNAVFLVDFGLACRYTQKEFKPDPKKAHNGTIEYTSRDAHDGVPTRRGDMEILAYNMIQWAGCTLPWENNLTDPVTVQTSKKKHMQDVPKFLTACFGKEKVPSALKEFVEYVGKMEYNTAPDYKKCRAILMKGLKESGGKLTDQLDFNIRAQKHKTDDEVDISSTTPEKKRKLPSKRAAKSKIVKETVSDSEVDASPVRKTRTPKQDVPENSNGYTAEMLRIKEKLEEKKRTGKKTTRTRKVNIKKDESDDDNLVEATPEKYRRKRKTVKKIVANEDVESDSDRSDDDNIVEATPPEKYRRKRKTVKKIVANEDVESDSDVTPRSFRQRK